LIATLETLLLRVFLFQTAPQAQFCQCFVLSLPFYSPAYSCRPCLKDLFFLNDAIPNTLLSDRGPPPLPPSRRAKMLFPLLDRDQSPPFGSYQFSAHTVFRFSPVWCQIALRRGFVSVIHATFRLYVPLCLSVPSLGSVFSFPLSFSKPFILPPAGNFESTFRFFAAVFFPFPFFRNPPITWAFSVGTLVKSFFFFSIQPSYILKSTRVLSMTVPTSQEVLSLPSVLYHIVPNSQNFSPGPSSSQIVGCCLLFVSTTTCLPYSSFIWGIGVRKRPAPISAVPPLINLPP